MDKDVAARLDALEEALAHQARMIEDLSEVIAARDGEIARLGRRVTLLMQAAAERELDAGGSIPLADQRPPHY
ncbi:MAG: SlyX family protein [Paracoccus sp. (in: a-proteobacteria)]|jgi:SlyX protein|uniref:SlyX family protein n=1 Tax=unclassified Paracoccus (in: a-proteobacteria) TaxID=2688777 RepID=UPI0025D8C7AD|nr:MULTISPECIES: SlyX family protein [unclassified Paracoccus (in: a-proteobacteria)]MCS5601243.1 SlyX family protein [Paracoccus sp. (in: a-proteobacteria)]|tara:strand:+ start:314 stop:532 length:219 start_codon:yes stop_codon:yes gene_type:complete